jgi:hypothetical protein
MANQNSMEEFERKWIVAAALWRLPAHRAKRGALCGLADKVNTTFFLYAYT